MKIFRMSLSEALMEDAMKRCFSDRWRNPPKAKWFKKLVHFKSLYKWWMRGPRLKSDSMRDYYLGEQWGSKDKVMFTVGKGERL